VRKSVKKLLTSTKFIILTAVFLLLLETCSHKKPKVERAFYYWKNNAYSLFETEKSTLDSLKVKKLYIKFFEVEKDPIFGTKPIAKSDLHVWNYHSDQVSDQDFLSNKNALYEIIPTIFIKNDVFYKATSPSLDTLADNILFLIYKYYKEKYNPPGIDFSEIQIDCDWTKNTKFNYFSLLTKIRKLSGKKISITLRLYPYKYRDIMGIPPVDKVTLMCYNLTNPLENKDQNSIQNNNELEKYLKNAEKYPLPLDIALPVFSWLHLYQNNHFAGIIHQHDKNLFEALEKIKPLWYSLNRDVETGNLYLRRGDIVKFEEVTVEETMQTIALLKKYISFDDSITVTLFHLDENNLKQFKNETLSSFYTDFTQ